MPPMNVDQAKHDLDRTLDPGGTGRVAPRQLRAAWQLLSEQGAAALGMEPTPGLSLADVIAAAARARASPDRRCLALLLVHALGVDGVVRGRPRRGGLDRDICALMESALHTVLRRSGYPFEGATYDKIAFIERLHGTIEQHLRPPEPTFPGWLSGMKGGGTG